MIYLDNAATSFPKPPGVVEAVVNQLTVNGGNAGRASHSLALNASRLVFEAKQKLSGFLCVKNAQNLIFTKNATEALNLAIMGSVKNGDTVAVSSLEHNSVMRPLRFLEKSKGIKLIIFKCDEFGSPDSDDFDRVLKLKPDFMVITAASNVTGAILPFEEMTQKAESKGIIVCIDASQLVGHYKFTPNDFNPSYFCFSGHKGLFAPTGTGGVYIRDGLKPEPLIRGGTGSISEQEYQPDFMPDAYEAGTQNLTGWAGMIAALDFIQQTGLENIIKKEEALIHQLETGLATIKDLKIYAKGGPKTPVLSVTSNLLSCSEMAELLDKKDIAVRMGLHCSPLAHKTIGSFKQGGTVRFSPSFFTLETEIEIVIKEMKDILK